MNRLILITVIVAFLQLLSFEQKAAAQNIGQRTFQYKDEKRNRPVITEIWYPTTDTLTQKDKAFSPFIRLQTVRNGKAPAQKMPLVFISHGAGGGRLTLEWLADKLVQNGFIVAAVDHYGNTFDHPTAEGFLEPWERPQDISFALTALLKDGGFGKVIDAQRLGMAGFSIGGYTTLALAGVEINVDVLKAYYKSPIGKREIDLPEFPGLLNFIDKPEVANSFKNAPPLKDARFKAFFAICPAAGQGFVNKGQVKKIHNPVYIIAAQADSIAPTATNALQYHELIGKSKYYVVKGKTGHYVFLNEAIDALKKEEPTYFKDDASVSRKQVHEEVSQLAADFFKANLK
jgi:predicted dienelactone hydrolase